MSNIFGHKKELKDLEGHYKLSSFDEEDQELIRRWQKYTSQTFNTAHLPRLFMYFVIIPIFIITIIWWSVHIGKPELKVEWADTTTLGYFALTTGLTLAFFGIGYYINYHIGLTYFDRKKAEKKYQKMSSSEKQQLLTADNIQSLIKQGNLYCPDPNDPSDLIECDSALDILANAKLMKEKKDN